MILPVEPRRGVDRNACDFYHVFDWPDGSPTPDPQYDLRSNIDTYLGNVDFHGKSVIEVGPASGFITFQMEKRGASVDCIEPPLTDFWDFIPRAGTDQALSRRQFGAHITRIRNSYWYAHETFKSRAKVYEQSAYDLPDELGRYDIGLLAALLVHVASPVKMIESVAKLVTDTIIVTDRLILPPGDALCRLAPAPNNSTTDTWWEFSPTFFVNFLGLLGFNRQTYTEHRALYVRAGLEVPMFTIVAQR